MDYLVKPLVPVIIQAEVAGFIELFKNTREAEHQAQRLQELERREAGRMVSESRAYAESIVETVREPLVILTHDLRVKSANRSFYQTFHVTQEETQDQFIYELGTVSGTSQPS